MITIEQKERIRYGEYHEQRIRHLTKFSRKNDESLFFFNINNKIDVMIGITKCTNSIDNFSSFCDCAMTIITVELIDTATKIDK